MHSFIQSFIHSPNSLTFIALLLGITRHSGLQGNKRELEAASTVLVGGGRQ